MTSRKWAWWFSNDDEMPHGGWQRISDVDDPTFDAVAESMEPRPDPPLDLWRNLSRLTESQRFVIHLRYGLGGCSVTPLEDIALMMKISNQAVSRLEQRALATLRKRLETGPKVDGIQFQRPAKEEA